MPGDGLGGGGDLGGVGDIDHQRCELPGRSLGERGPVGGLSDARIDVAAAGGQAQGGGRPIPDEVPVTSTWGRVQALMIPPLVGWGGR